MEISLSNIRLKKIKSIKLIHDNKRITEVTSKCLKLLKNIYTQVFIRALN